MPQRSAAWPCPSPTRRSRRGCASGWRRSRRRSTGTCRASSPSSPRRRSHLLDAGGKRFRPLLVLLAAEAGDHPERRRRGHRGLRRGDHPRRLALPRRRHGRGRSCAAGSASANARWDNLVAILTGDFLFAKSSELTALLGADAVRIQAETFTRLVEGQILETVEPGPGEDPLAHYLEVVAGKTGSLIATSARYGARFGGASPGGRGGAGGVRRDRRAPPSSSPTTSSTSPPTRSSPARRPAPTSARASRRCRCSWPRRPPTRPTPGCSSCSPARSPTTRCTPRRSACCACTRPWTEARAYVVARATEAKPLLGVLPDGPVRAALEAFADVVATRSS